MLHGLPVTNWFLEYRRLGMVQHHETSVGLSFARVLFEFSHDGTTLPGNGLFKRSVLRYKGKKFIIVFGLFDNNHVVIFYFSSGDDCQSVDSLCESGPFRFVFSVYGPSSWRIKLHFRFM